MRINTKNRLAHLVGKGYFPEELDFVFNTKDLGAFVKKQSFNLEKYRRARNAEVPDSSKLIHFSVPHTRGYRRILGIPGPFHYTQLADSLIENHEAISAKITESDISIFKDFTSLDTRRYIEKPDFKAFTTQRIIRSVGFRYMLTLDVTRFYASIYTHSLPWALYGKEFAKDKDNQGREHYGNLLDIYARSCNDKQTMGLPIGPDTSRILSEIILSQVDKKLHEKLSDFRGIRNVDDYYLYFKTYSDAEKGKSLLQKLLRDYELELNVAKEKIIQLPEIIESKWKREIRSSRLRDDSDFERIDLIAFFDLTFTLVRDHPEEIILPYAIAKLKKRSINTSNWNIFQAFLLNSLILDSRVILKISYILLRNKGIVEVQDNKALISKAFESFLIFHAEHDHHYELVCALFFYHQCGWRLPQTAAAELNKSTNDFVILMMLALRKNDLIEGELDTTKWQEFLNSNQLVSEHWLLAYQAAASNYLNWDASYLNHRKFFADLKNERVSFMNFNTDYEDDPGIEDSKSSLAREIEAFDPDNEYGFRSDENDREHQAFSNPGDLTDDDLPF